MKAEIISLPFLSNRNIKLTDTLFYQLQPEISRDYRVTVKKWKPISSPTLDTSCHSRQSLLLQLSNRLKYILYLKPETLSCLLQLASFYKSFIEASLHDTEQQGYLAKNFIEKMQIWWWNKRLCLYVSTESSLFEICLQNRDCCRAQLESNVTDNKLWLMHDST